MTMTADLTATEVRQLAALAALRVKHRAADTAHADELTHCREDRAYFIDTYCQIKAKQADTEDDKAPATWQPFTLWDCQREVVAAVATGEHLIILKARQLGQTWLIIACILWAMLLRPMCTVLLFSKRDNEASDLLQRLKEMYAHLPAWLQAQSGGVLLANTEVWRLGNGSEARTQAAAGDSYTAQIALCDEFDLRDDQDALLEAVQPTVIESGQLILLSRVDKDKPLSAFKRLYAQAKAGALQGWRAIFLPWQARPGRTDAWRAAREAESLAKDGTLDAVQAQYPVSDGEALAQRSGNKRLPGAWLTACYQDGAVALPDAVCHAAQLPAIPGLVVYALPVAKHAYCLGADPAEGNPTSDASAATLLDKATGEEVAALVGQFQPEEFAHYCVRLARAYHEADILPERNNHGHAFILACKDRAYLDHVLRGTDGKPGWLTTAPSKARLYDTAAELFREGDARINSLDTYLQLGSIEGASLSAPDGQHDDRAMGYVLAQKARTLQIDEWTSA